MRAAAVRKMARWAGFVQKLGPYLLLEIVLPGGTLIALLLFLYQRKQLAEGAADMPVIASAIGTLRTDLRLSGVQLNLDLAGSSIGCLQVGVSRFVLFACKFVCEGQL